MSRTLSTGISPANSSNTPIVRAELQEDLLESGQQLGGMIGRLPEPPNMEATAPHAFFGDLDCKSWYLFQRVHDADHMQQIEAAKQAPGFPGGE